MEIKIRKPTDDEKKEASAWPIWSCEPSSFDWGYAEEEVCLVLEGEVEVTANGKTVKIGQGDWVVFPQGLSCRWTVRKAIKKHYSFNP